MRTGGAVYQRFPSVHAAGYGYLCIVGYHNGVIHQHSHGDDKACQRGTVQSHSQERHDEQCAANGKYQRRADEYAGAHPHYQHDDDDYNQNGFYQVDNKSVVRFFGNDVFGVKTFQFQPYGDEGEEFGELLVYQLTGFYHILLWVGGDADTDGPFPVYVHDGAGRVHVSLFNDGYIAQFDLSAGGGDCLVTDVVDGGISTVGYNAQLLFACTDFTRIDNLVLRLQQACQLFGVDAHSRQFVYGDKDVDYFRLCAEQGYFHNPFGSDNLRLDTFRPVAHFFIGETVVADQPVVNAEYIAEVVRYRRYGSFCRKLGLYVENLPAQFVPFLRDRCCGKRRL